VAWFIAAGVDSSTNPIDFEHRAQMSGILEPLTWEPDSTPERSYLTGQSSLAHGNFFRGISRVFLSA
jgi:hypothetical protein